MSDTIQQDSGKPQFSIEQIRARRKRDCALGYRLFAAQKWGDLGDGHISARRSGKNGLFLDVALWRFLSCGNGF